jgi:transcription initiation factor IIE alpha subunit
MITNIKNVPVTESSFTIQKECNRCKNMLYFSDSAISCLEMNEHGSVVHASIKCPICGSIIVLYSNRHGSGSPIIDIKTVRLEDDK